CKTLIYHRPLRRRLRCPQGLDHDPGFTDRHKAVTVIGASSRTLRPPPPRSRRPPEMRALRRPGIPGTSARAVGSYRRQYRRRAAGCRSKALTISAVLNCCARWGPRRLSRGIITPSADQGTASCSVCASKSDIFRGPRIEKRTLVIATAELRG